MALQKEDPGARNVKGATIIDMKTECTRRTFCSICNLSTEKGGCPIRQSYLIIFPS